MPSSAELIADVASEAAVTQKDVKSVIEALTKIAGRELKKNSRSRFQGLGRDLEIAGDGARYEV